MFVYVFATLDTKGDEARYVRDLLSSHGVPARLVDVSCSRAPAPGADVARDEILAAAGCDAASAAGLTDRGQAVTAAAAGAAAWIHAEFLAGRVAGVMALGGSAGTTIGSAAMRALPLGIPKLMISTLASGQVRHYVADKDILMLNAIVDLAGLNRVSRRVLAEAAAAMAGMVQFSSDGGDDRAERPLVAATMFGVTTPCVERAKSMLEAAGYEVLVFHATGGGGMAMESLIDDGIFEGVLDITTTELADELVGGFLSAGPTRLTAAGRRGVPQVVSVGATDMVNFHAPASVPSRFSGRTFYHHNAHVTLMRTTGAECAAIGADMGRKLSAAQGPVRVLLPARGVSTIDRQGAPFDDPLARRALADALRASAGEIAIEEQDLHINDPDFAELAASRLLEMMQRHRASRAHARS
jgi:uncharacterized protein (UPF0261 family)